MAGKEYAAFDHDKNGHAGPDIEPGSLSYDESAGRVVCSEHGDSCAIDGSLERGAAQAAQVGITDEGIAIFDHKNAKPIGKSRLYRCTVCGQGTWSYQG